MNQKKQLQEEFVGGKRKLLNHIIPNKSIKEYYNYHELFIGGVYY